jgi:hypothetical protein
MTYRVVHGGTDLTGGYLPGADATATRAVNAIAAVSNAIPAVHLALDLVVTPAGPMADSTHDEGVKP